MKQLHDLCRNLPAATEDVKWGDHACFSVGGKMFAIFGQEDGPTLLSFKCSAERFEELIGKPGFIPAPYLAKNKWVAVTDFSALMSKDVKDGLRESHRLVASKLTRKLRAALGLDGERS